MSFSDWIFSNYAVAGSSIPAPWGLAHILTLVICIVFIVVLPFVLKKQKAKDIFIWAMLGLLIILGLSRRIINLIHTLDYSFNNIARILLPRPWCAMACWTVIIAKIVDKKFLYNFASTSGLLCTLIFFAYPGVGFRQNCLLFEDLYSIMTHALLLIISVSYITLKYTDFDYKQFWKVAVCYVMVLAYSFIQIYVLKIEANPMYFMPNGDIQTILGVGYGVYLPLYILLTLFYFNLFPLIQTLYRKMQIKKKNKNNKI